MIFGVLWLFVTHADLGLSDLNHPVLRHLSRRSRARWFWETRFRARSRFARHAVLRRQLGHLVLVHGRQPPREDRAWTGGDREHAGVPAREVLRQRGTSADIPCTRDMRSAGSTPTAKRCSHRAPRALAGRNEDDYIVTEGERLCSTAVGWNFGDGHMHNEQLIAAMQERCHFDPERCASSCSMRNRSTSRPSSIGSSMPPPENSKAAMSASRIW